MVQESVWQIVFHHGIVVAAVGGGVDREQQRGDAVAAEGGRAMQGVGRKRQRVGNQRVTPSVGERALTYFGRVGQQEGGIDRELHQHGTVGTVVASQGAALAASGGEETIVPRQRQLIVAHGAVDHRRHIVQQPQVEDDGAVAPVDGLSQHASHHRVAHREIVGRNHRIGIEGIGQLTLDQRAHHRR